MSVDQKNGSIQVRSRKRKSKGLITLQHEFKIDLKTKKEVIYIYRCNPSLADISTNIVSKALLYKRHKIGWNFCKHCALKNRVDETVPRLNTKQDEFRLGDEIVYVKHYDEENDTHITTCMDKKCITRKEENTHVNSTDDVFIGDAVIYSYWGLWHEGIVVDLE